MELMNLRRGLMASMPQTKDFKLIRRLTLTEDSQSVVIDTDDNGLPFTLNGFVIAMNSVGATGSTSEGPLKIAVNSTAHNVNRILDIPSGIRKQNSTISLIVMCSYFPGIGHSVFLTRGDNMTCVDAAGNFTKTTIYNTSTMSGFLTLSDITKIFVGSDTSSRLLGAGTIIAVYGCRK